MRVAQFIDTAAEGGAETVVLELCRQLRMRSVDPVLLHFGSPYLSRQARQLGVEQHVLPGHRYYKSTRTLPLFALQLSRLLRAREIDVLHSHLFGPITAAAPACLLAGVPHVGTLHDVYVVDERPARIHLLQLAALLGTRLVCVSEDMEAFYRRRGLFWRQALRTVYNGTSSMPAPQVPDLRQALGLSDADLLVICVGRLVRLKNHQLLLRAFAGLDTPQPAHLLLVGDGPLRDQLHCLATELDIAERVHFLGRRDDVPALLAASDIFALCSDTEGLSCSILEAMAAGLPVVATRVGGNSELVTDGSTGYLVEPDDVAAVQARLLALALDPARRQRFGRAAQQRIATQFSLDVMLEAYLRQYAAPCNTAAAAVRRD